MTRRPPVKVPDKKPNSNAAALQGATLAFAARGAKKSSVNDGENQDTHDCRIDIPISVQPRISKTDGARKAALLANAASGQSSSNTQDSDESIAGSAAGTVRDRIQLFSDSSLPNTRVSQAEPAQDTQSRDNVRTNPQHIAAQLAVCRSKTPVPSTQIPSSQAVRTMGRLESNNSHTTSPNDQDVNINSSTSIYVMTENGNDTTFMESPADRRPAAPKPRDKIISDLTKGKKETLMASESNMSQRRVAARVACHGGAGASATSTLQPSSPPIPPKPPSTSAAARNASIAAERPPPPPPRPATATRPLPLPLPLPLGESENPTTGTLRSRHLTTQDSRSSLRSQHSGMSESSRAHAIAASSIATSRTSSPSKRNTPPPPPPHRRSRSRSRLHLHPTHNILDRSANNGARNVSPAKSTTSIATSNNTSTTMRRTMRPQKSESDTHNKSGNQHHHHHRLKIRSHPHKHREGDRKRWRDQVTERERKRYEGVWAANKGLWITADEQTNLLNKSLDLEDMVVSMVVRDIWSRSRLPRTLLEQIWNLVSGDGRALLSREEFVVGMWLIDQSLKGRKLPAKVSQSVWDSVRAGVNWRNTSTNTTSDTS